MWRAAGIDMSRVDSRLWHVLGWAFVLELITRTRQLVLVPLTLATAPALALDGGLDALNAALNGMPRTRAEHATHAAHSTHTHTHCAHATHAL
jgi:hypothetical protein